MFDIIDRITNLNSGVLRNTPGVNLNFNVFDDLSDDPTAWMEAQRTVESPLRFTKSQLHYNAIDFVFLQRSWMPTRFGDGSFPVWYGSLELETTFAETVFHWKQTILNDAFELFSNYKEPIYTARTVFNTKCQSTLADLRGKETQLPSLIEKSTKYHDTQSIGLKFSKEGMPGLITKSARQENGTNVVVFNKNILATPSVNGDFLYEITPDNLSLTRVLHYTTKDLITTI